MGMYSVMIQKVRLGAGRALRECSFFRWGNRPGERKGLAQGTGHCSSECHGLHLPLVSSVCPDHVPELGGRWEGTHFVKEVSHH